MKKKLMSLALAVVMCVSLCVPAFAVEAGGADCYELAEYGPESIVYCREITFEEAVEQKMNYDNISYEDAKEQLLAEENRILTQLGVRNVTSRTNERTYANDIIKYQNYEKEFSYPGNSSFRCAITATVVTFSDYGHTRLIDRVDMLSTRRVSGLYDYDWIEKATSSNISYDKTSVRLSATGHFTTSITSSHGGTIEIIPGFSYSGSVGTTSTYLSETMYPTTTFYA